MTSSLIAAVIIAVAVVLGGAFGLKVGRLMRPTSGGQSGPPAPATIAALLGLIAAIFTGWAVGGGNVVAVSCGAIVAIALLAAAKRMHDRERRS